MQRLFLLLPDMYYVLLPNLRVLLYADLPICNRGCLKMGTHLSREEYIHCKGATHSLVLSPQQRCSAVYLGSVTRPRCHWNSRDAEPTQGWLLVPVLFMPQHKALSKQSLTLLAPPHSSFLPCTSQDANTILSLPVPLP